MENKIQVAYLCDMKKCRNCTGKTYRLCFHTLDKTHAKYKDDDKSEFERYGNVLFEKEREQNGKVQIL